MTYKRTNQLQFLRFLAFLLIFLWHCGSFGVPFYPGISGATNGVTFFIILSGFVSAYSAYDREIKSGIGDILAYLIKKLRKFYPLYFVTTLCTVGYSSLPSVVAAYNIQGIVESLKQLAKNLLLIQSWFTEGYFSYNGVGWFLSTIIFLYIVNLPLEKFLKKIQNYKNSVVYYLGMIVLAYALLTGYCYCFRNKNLQFWEYVFPPARLAEYFIGAVLGNVVRYVVDQSEKCSVKRKKYATMVSSTAGFTIFEAVALFYWVYAMYQEVDPWKQRILYWVIPNMAFITVFSFGYGLVSKVFLKPPFVFLGNISFECFLIHQIIISLYTYVSGATGVSSFGNLFSIIFCLMLTIILAALPIFLRKNNENLLGETHG